jgi:Fe/S biogenesis protein NfuA
MRNEILNITDEAVEKLSVMRDENQRQGYALRVAIRGRGPFGFMYQLGFVPVSNRSEDDSVVDVGGMEIYIDSESMPNLIGSTLEFVESNGQSGFQIDNPNPLWHDPISLKVQEVLDTRINPSIAMHGGMVSLESVEEDTAYVILGGGCQGCGMARVTLSQGIDGMIKQWVPEIKNVVDVTDHAAGKNPFYKKAEQGASPLDR